MAPGGPGGEPGPDGGGVGPGPDEEKYRVIPGPPPADALKLVMLAVVSEDVFSYSEVTESRKMNRLECYVYDKFFFSDRWTYPGLFYLEQPRGPGELQVFDDRVHVVKAMVEVDTEALEMHYDDSDWEFEPKTAGVIHEVVASVTFLRRDRWQHWKPPKRVKMG